MDEEQKQAYLNDLIALVNDADDLNTHGLEMLQNKLNDIKHKHGALVLQDILNTIPKTSDDSKPGIAILDQTSTKNVEATKLLLINGAQPFKKAYLSPMTGKVIVAAIQQIKGASFAPTFIDYSAPDVGSQLEQFEAYLTDMHEHMLVADIDSQPINKTFIIATAAHWSCCQMQFSKNSSGDPELQIYFLDASGLKYWNDQLLMLSKTAQAIFNVDHIKIYRNTLPIQSDSGCKIFTLIFARMLHSLALGKFKQVNPNYNLFTDLATIPGKKSRLGDVTITDLADLPAKFLQLDQRFEKVTIDRSVIVNSTGKNLGKALAESMKRVKIARFGQEYYENHNKKVTTKFTNMRDMMHNFFAHAKSDAEKLAQLNSVDYQFSTANLSISKIKLGKGLV